MNSFRRQKPWNYSYCQYKQSRNQIEKVTLIKEQTPTTSGYMTFLDKHFKMHRVGFPASYTEHTGLQLYYKHGKNP